MGKVATLNVANCTARTQSLETAFNVQLLKWVNRFTNIYPLHPLFQDI